MNKEHRGMNKKAPLMFLLFLASLAIFGCAKQPEEIPFVTLAKGVKLPAVSALAWLSPEDFAESFKSEVPAEGCFVSAAENGEATIWDAFSGRPLRSFSQGEINLTQGAEDKSVFFLSHNADGSAGYFSRTLQLSAVFPVLSPDGSKSLLPLDDGSVCLLEAGSGREAARYYAFTFSGAESAEWISVCAEGFYNSSDKGASFLEFGTNSKRYTLSRLAETYLRPDLFNSILLGEEFESPVSPAGLFGDEAAPPFVSLSFQTDEGRAALLVKITEQAGGTGMLYLYSRSAGKDIPRGLFSPESTAEKTRGANGETCYELVIPLEGRFPKAEMFGVSVFNRDNTIESERVFASVPKPPPGAAVYENTQGGLRVLIASGAAEETKALGEFFSLQKESALYSAVELAEIYGSEYSRASFISTLDALCAESASGDTAVLYIAGKADIDSFGNLSVSAAAEEENGERKISANDIIKGLLKFDSALLLLDLESDAPGNKIETAVLRFYRRLGPKAAIASFSPSGVSPVAYNGTSLAAAVTEALEYDFENPFSADNAGKGRYAGAAELLNPASGGNLTIASMPLEDFRIADRFLNAGEMKFQTMASGMLKIDRVDSEPVPLIFGDTMTRVLSPGYYIIDMIYRNGYRETRTVNLAKNDSTWVIFTYTPPLLVGDFSRQLPSLGINISELDPENYERIDREAMEAMGMAPYYVAFLAGENLYREGSYDRAIAEYSRAISLKADYADAFASRGNAHRKKGNYMAAIEDYTRALRLKSGLPEIYNYRGFLYARTGDLGRAISDYTQAIRYMPDYTDAYFNRGHAHREQGNWDRAIADYTQVIRLEPENAAAYLERGRALAGKGDESGAERDYSAAEKLMP